MKRVNVLATAIALVILLAGFFAYKAISKPKDEVALDPVKVIQSGVTMKDGKVEVKLDDKAIQSLMHDRQRKMLDDYFAVPEGKARKDYLDKKIDEMEKMRKMMEENGPTTQPSGSGSWQTTSKDGTTKTVRKFQIGGPDAAMQKTMAETIPADVQARMAQYVKDMKDRRAERGLPDGPAGIMIRVPGPGK